MMVVGLYQPPMRVGAMRLIHNTTSLNKECVYENCK